MNEIKKHREIGMLFADEMMLMNIKRIKDQTRRPLDPQPPADVEMKEHSKFPGYWIPYRGRKLANDVQGTRKDDCGFYAPYLVGDIIYGREAFCEFKETPIMDGIEVGLKKVRLKHPVYRSFPTLTSAEKKAYKWRPSIHMPKKLARWRAKVVEVRVERLQNLTAFDAIDEGVVYNISLKSAGDERFVRGLFEDRWNHHYGRSGKGLRWEVNPWVWVVKYVHLQLPNCKERSDGFSCNLIYPDSYHCAFALNLGNCPEGKRLVFG